MQSPPPALPKVKSDRSVQYFYFRDAIEKISTAAELASNEEYLKAVCKDDAKVASCGDDCSEFSSKGATTEIRWNTWRVTLQIGHEQEGRQLAVALRAATAGDGSASLMEISSALERALDQLTVANRFDKIPIDYISYYCAYSLYLRMHDWLGPQAWKLEVKETEGKSS